MEDDINKVIEVTESLRARSKGRYFENIAEICHESFGWDEVKTTALLDKALSGKKIYTATVHNKLSYRKCENRTICIGLKLPTGCATDTILDGANQLRGCYEKIKIARLKKLKNLRQTSAPRKSSILLLEYKHAVRRY